ncbi:hypothetical protein GUJ93_ZPchr0001g31647 [Zizania palustris]|uniref:Uncharacterized protein n=1 Tax=Zizania palustris TaxID=103762 RepID=A0A8J5RV68_ZIZPA|nr:hypothetical protein GUJ93_ZPchr0001g31647 [Zizania palustris]
MATAASDRRRHADEVEFRACVVPFGSFALRYVRSLWLHSVVSSLPFRYICHLEHIIKKLKYALTKHGPDSRQL